MSLITGCTIQTSLTQRGGDILTPSLGQRIKTSLKSFVQSCQCPPRCRVLSNEWEMCSDKYMPPIYCPFCSILACSCLLQITPRQIQLLVGLMLWTTGRRKLVPVDDQSMSLDRPWWVGVPEQMYPLQSVNPTWAAKAQSKWASTSAFQASISPTP